MDNKIYDDYDDEDDDVGLWYIYNGGVYLSCNEKVTTSWIVDVDDDDWLRSVNVCWSD